MKEIGRVQTKLNWTEWFVIAYERKGFLTTGKIYEFKKLVNLNRSFSCYETVNNVVTTIVLFDIAKLLQLRDLDCAILLNGIRLNE